MTAAAPDARTQREGACGATRIVGGTEFVCIAKVHDQDTERRPRRTDLAVGWHPESERHRFVARNRLGEDQ